MYKFTVKGKEYKVRFTYKAVCRGDVLDKFTTALAFETDNTPRAMLNHIVTVTAEMLIAGLQKYHSDEFGYKSEEEKEKIIEKVFDLFDDYEDEATEDHPQSAATLFVDMKEELEKNGFLSAMANTAEEVENAMETVDQVKTEMSQEPARVAANSTTPTENKS